MTKMAKNKGLSERLHHVPNKSKSINYAFAKGALCGVTTGLNGVVSAYAFDHGSPILGIVCALNGLAATYLTYNHFRNSYYLSIKRK